MQEKLIIYLHAKALDLPGWAVVNTDGYVSQSAYQDSPEGLATIADGKEVIVFVPAEDVFLTQVTLPKINRARLAEVLPFALEEQLIADVETLHFAPGDATAEGGMPVMVVAHEKMQAWLSQLQAWQIKPHSLFPSVYGLPIAEGTWQVAIDEIAMVRSGPGQGFACDKHNLSIFLTGQWAASPFLPQRIEIRNYTDEVMAATLDVPVTLVEEKATKDQLLTDWARLLTVLPSRNLLQGRYAVKKSTLPQTDKLWKAITYLAITLIALIFLYPLTSYFILKQKLTSLDQQIVQIYKRHFPQAKAMVAPKMRMEEKLQKLVANRGESSLLSLLSYVGKGMQAAPNVKLKRVDFQGGAFSLELTAASSEEFALFTDFLTRQGLVVKQKNANLDGGRVNAMLEIES